MSAGILPALVIAGFQPAPLLNLILYYCFLSTRNNLKRFFDEMKTIFVVSAPDQFRAILQNYVIATIESRLQFPNGIYIHDTGAMDADELSRI
jgi:hypothetical protein